MPLVPLRSSTLYHTLALSLGAVLVALAVRVVVWSIGADDAVDRSVRMLAAGGLLVSFTLGLLALVACLYAASAYGMAVLRETACGVDVVRDWPNLLLLESTSEVFFVLNSVALAALPGRLAAPLWRWLGVPMPWGIAATVLILLPVLLLSMLAAESPIHPLTRPIVASLGRRSTKWLAFYATSCVLTAAGAAVHLGLRRYCGSTVYAIVLGVVVALVWMIYFRLLGRLASCCSLHPKAGVAKGHPPNGH